MSTTFEMAKLKMSNIRTVPRRDFPSALTVILTFGIWFVAPTAVAQTTGGAWTESASWAPMLHPNLERGGDDQRRFHEHEYDKVNVFNGNLRLSIPIGLEYPITENFSYQLTLQYNSNAWDIKETSYGAVKTDPAGFFNAGMGWDLSLGRLVSPGASGNSLDRWIYLDSQGGVHAFYDSPHADVDLGTSSDALYTRDGTYLRLQQTAPGERIVEFGNGRTKIFRQDASTGVWRLHRIQDPFGNFLEVSYGDNLWTLTDSRGRTHYVRFEPAYYLPTFETGGADEIGPYTKTIKQVELAAPEGGTAVFDFEYLDSRVIERPAVDSSSSSEDTVAVPLLSRLTAPDGTAHEMRYNADTEAGRIVALTLPTGGKVSWEYSDYPFIADGCAGPSTLPKILAGNRGVHRRRHVAPNGTIEGSWVYQTWLIQGPAQDVCNSVRRVTNVKTPLNDQIRYWFTVSTQPVGDGSSIGPADYALPYAKDVARPNDTYISKRWYDCQPDGSQCAILRDVFTRLEQDHAVDPRVYDFFKTNRRMTHRRTVFHDDQRNGGNVYAEVVLGDYDGLGHHRVKTYRGNFERGNGKQRAIGYSAAEGTYPSTAWSMPLESEPWILNVFDYTRVSHGPRVETVDYCFDASTGFKTRERKRLSADAPTSDDVVIRHKQRADGQIAETKHFGGDLQSIATTGDLCDLPLPAKNRHHVRYAYENGVRSRAVYVDETGAEFGPPFLNRRIDLNTGLALSETDSSGLTVHYEYDAMGRVIWRKPEAAHGGAWIRYVYYAPNSGHGGAVRTRAYQNGGGGAALRHEIEFSDFFGRTWIERKYVDGGTETVVPQRITKYNALGWVSRQSYFTTGTAQWTHYFDYDPFGRVGTVRPPGGPRYDVDFEYQGERVVKRTARRGLYEHDGQVIMEPRSRSKHFDRMGRLWKTIEHGSDATGSPDVVTTHARDVAGRLIVKHRDGERVSIRRDFDGRGFPTRIRYSDETHDVQSTTVLGQVAEYRREWAGGKSRLVENEYDRAGRRTSLKVQTFTYQGEERPYNYPNTPDDGLIKEFIYAASNGANDRRAGKLWKTVQYHDFDQLAEAYYTHADDIQWATVTETLTYGGIGGRVSDIEIQLKNGGGLVERVTHGYRYSPLGEITSISYPDENGGHLIIGRRGNDREVTMDHSLGRLTRISDTYGSENRIIAELAYHPNGLTAEVRHANGVTWKQTPSPTGEARPVGVKTAGVTNSWGHPRDIDIASIEYDAEGGIVRIDNEFLVPDRVPHYSPPTEPDYVTSTIGCYTSWEDASGMRIASPGNYLGACDASRLHYHTARGELFKLEILGSDPRTFWYIRNKDGRLLTEHKRFHHNMWPNKFLYTRDFFYADSRTLMRHTIPHLRGAPDPEPTERHYHPAPGGNGVTTDKSGQIVE